MGFSDFIAPFDAASFRTQYFGKLPVHIRRNGDSHPSLLPWSRFNEVLAITPYWNEDTLKVYLQVYCKSRAALRESYCDTTRRECACQPCQGQGAAGARGQSRRQSREPCLPGSGCSRQHARGRISATWNCSPGPASSSKPNCSSSTPHDVAALGGRSAVPPASGSILPE